MLYTRREAREIRNGIQDVHQKLEAYASTLERMSTDGTWQDCAETTPREIRQMRVLIIEASLAWQELMQHFPD